MGGGGSAESIPVWDLSSLIGATLLIGTVLMALWSPSHDLSLESGSGVVQITSVDVGLLGSSDAVQIDVSPGETCSGDNATTCSLIVNIGPESFEFNEAGGDATSQRSSDGPLNVTVEGEGDYTLTVSVQRQLPLEALPVILGLFLVIWGEWRKRQ
ncbi:MAG TPA: hypothetical protein HA345_05250 [Candidatus Thalassarchaeaceae archaeon]|nr:MAG TPA: hypothetical protein D7H94_05240 [Candidatus Poseidoniales archaeon]HIH84796.1 hypothetical protein [Candidatus Thalassarchaeaceae archaeon]